MPAVVPVVTDFISKIAIRDTSLANLVRSNGGAFVAGPASRSTQIGDLEVTLVLVLADGDGSNVRRQLSSSIFWHHMGLLLVCQWGTLRN